MRTVLSALLAAAVLTVACNESGTNPDDCTVSAVAITGAPANLDVDETVQLTANITSEGCDPAPTATWASSSNAIATVSTSGLVTGESAGEVTITASSGGKQGTATFDIVVTPIASVRITPDSIVIGVGTGPTLRAEALDAGQNVLPGRTFTWTPDNPANVTVSGTGVLTGVTAGTTVEVTATSEGIDGSAMVHVVRPRLAFFWNDVTVPVGTEVPDGLYSYSSGAGALSISSSVPGVYSAGYLGIESMDFETEALFTTIYGGTAGSYCRISSWGLASAGVNCHNAAGVLENNNFTVAAVGSGTFSGRSGFAWIHDGAATVDTDWWYRFNPTGGSIVSTRNGVGSYTVRFENLGRVGAGDREGVMVSSYGGTGELTCQPASWTTVATHLDVEVRCFTAAGAAADTRFTVLVVDGARAGARLGFAHADQTATASYTPTNSAVRPTGSVLVTRNGVGDYTVEFTGHYRTAGLAETFLITATGVTPGRCTNGGWGFSNTVGGVASVDVTCTTTAGVAADMPFSIIALQ